MYMEITFLQPLEPPYIPTVLGLSCKSKAFLSLRCFGISQPSLVQTLPFSHWGTCKAFRKPSKSTIVADLHHGQQSFWPQLSQQPSCGHVQICGLASASGCGAARVVVSSMATAVKMMVYFILI